MLGHFARSFGFVSFPQGGLRQAGIRLGVASLLLLSGARGVHDATASGDTRTLSFHHTHSNEDLTVTFKRNGRYDEAALKQLNHYLRDWRSQDQTSMDPHLFDIIWEVYRDVDGKQPIQIVSAYRSPATNAMLRQRSAHSGVARFSQHMLGHAMDFYIPNVAIEQIRFAGLRLQRGGVGFYPTSGSPFVHLDTGSIRHWPRMTHDQLARVFPNGRTVHIPSDGNPLPGYELALADVQRRGSAKDTSFSSKLGLLTSLFRGKQQTNDDDDVSTNDAPVKGGKAAAMLTASAEATKSFASVSSASVPLPRAKPPATTAATYQIASAKSHLGAGSLASAVNPKPQTPTDIINARGFWGDEPTKPKQATPAQVAALAARNTLASLQPTASLPSGSQALAYALVARPLDRAHIVAASAPIPRSIRPTSPARNPMTAEITTIVTKGAQDQPSIVATNMRISPASMTSEIWMRAMIVAPSASTALMTTSFGDRDMTMMRHLFVKPTTTIAMTFSDDPQMGIACDHFSGSAVAALTTTSFTMRTASLR